MRLLHIFLLYAILTFLCIAQSLDSFLCFISLEKKNLSLFFQLALNYRSQRFTVKDQVTNSPYSSIIDNSATKRQKLEGGYLRKAADLKHHPVLQHKLSKKIGENIELLHSTVKLTVPREPHLETAHRTRMHRSMSDDGTKSKKFQVNHKPRAHSPDKELNISMSKHDATISSFQKLTLEHETETRSDSQSKCLKENVPFTQPVQEVVKVTGRKGNSSAGVGKQLLQGKCRK
ncbi:hypothetical protein SAY87_001488 [Trapa incisa]|uniref:Uncharacterized protein n=1 Tax=Trapa incisa TaxID=236973 RepID=A0AAN7GVC8_9MYRT|nr:hypothetical protein SAY87_001488 [Trapa incisa]